MRGRDGAPFREGLEKMVVAVDPRRPGPHRPRVDRLVVEDRVLPDGGGGRPAAIRAARRGPHGERHQHDAELILHGPAHVAFRVDRARHVVVEVAAFRHLAQEHFERERLVANRRKLSRGRRLGGVAGRPQPDGADRQRREREAGESGAAGRHRTRVPGSGGVSNPTSIGFPPSALAASTMPFDSKPIRFAGFKLKTMTTVRPTSASGSYASAMPATSVRCSVPTSTCSLISLFDLGTRSAASTFATRSSTFRKSSIEIRGGSSGACGASGSRGALGSRGSALSVT